MIEVRYAGAVVGRTSIVRELDTRGVFLGITEPLPVGTPVTLKIGDETVAGKVSGVAESQELARAGMRVRFADPAVATLFGTPDEAPPEAESVRAAPVKTAPVAEAAVPGAAAVAAPSAGHRRIVVDASSEPSDHAERSAPEAVAPPEVSEGTESAGAAGGGGQGESRKSKRNKRR